MREVAQLYWDFAREMHWKLAPLNSPLALLTGTSLNNPSMTPRRLGVLVPSHSVIPMSFTLQNWSDHQNSNYNIISKYMQLKISLYLHDLSDERFKLLPFYSDKSLPLPPELIDYTLDGLKRQWHALRNAQNNLMEHRARQLARAADLLESNPDILKLASDPGQQRRENIAHIIGGMKRAIQKMRKNSMIRGDGNTGKHYFFVYFPVVPFDASLRLLLKQLKARHQATKGGIEEENSIKILLAGISSIYTPHKQWQLAEETTQLYRRRKNILLTYPERIPRVMYKHQPYNEHQNPYTSDLDLEQLKFVSGYTKFYRFLPHAQRQNYRGNREASWDKHDDREVEWLEAFVKVYRSLQGEKSV
jgi:hypothetical protein